MSSCSWLIKADDEKNANITMLRSMDVKVDNTVSRDLQIIRLQRLLNAFTQMHTADNTDSAGLRNLNRFLFDIATLDGYGCWCRVSEFTHGGGKGVPVDVYDEFCNKLHMATTCLAMDFGDTCSPWTTDYQFRVFPTDIDCDDPNNGDPCKISLCLVESTFVLGILQTITNFNAPQMNHNMFNPNAPGFTNQWDPTQCNVPSGHTGGNPGGNGANGGNARPPVASFDLDCCGQYPERWPFKEALFDTSGNLISTKECCNFNSGDFGLNTFNPQNKVCCDGQLKNLGHVC